MSPAEIRSAVLDIARSELGLDTADGDGGRWQGALSAHLDSVQKLTLVVGIEDRFEICLSPEDDAGVDSLDDLVTLVAAHLDGPTDASFATGGHVDA